MRGDGGLIMAALPAVLGAARGRLLPISVQGEFSMATRIKLVRRISVLTGGDDCPGLNAMIRAVPKTAMNVCGVEVVRIRDAPPVPFLSILKIIGGRATPAREPHGEREPPRTARSKHRGQHPQSGRYRREMGHATATQRPTSASP